MHSKSRTESLKLGANTVNALAILLLAASLFSDWIGPPRALSVEVRGWMFVLGVALHACAHYVLSFLDRGEHE